MMATRRVHLMGTVIDVQIDDPKGEALADEVVARLKLYEHRFSANDETAELMQVNHQAGVAPVAVAPELFDLIALGKKYSLRPDGNLNIALGPLVKLWHIGFADAHKPSDEQIQARLALTDPHQIELDAQQQTVYLTQPGMELDLGALAKGYIADLLTDFLRAAGVKSALLNLGGNVVVIGGKRTNADGNWHVGLQDPAQPLGTYRRVLNLRDQSIVTSGIYQRNLKAHNHFYHHIFDKHTGYPTPAQITSLSIISPRSVDGEIWTTMLFGQDRATIEQTVAQLPQVRAIVIDQAGRLTQCAGPGAVAVM